MHNLFECYLTVGIFLLLGFISVSTTNDTHPWDILIFTQQWPQTVCHQWKKEDKKHNCQMPSIRNLWTVHGVWPTKYNEMGPFYCDPSKGFNVSEIETIESQLRIFWTNIELKTDQYDFWRHEWEKHGTCASILPELGTEIQYFRKGLQWLQHYSMSTILADAKILPDSTPNVEDIHTAVVTKLNRNPVIHCTYDTKRKEIFLEEIRICFNKSLELTDCDGVVGRYYPRHEYAGGKIITNCDPKKEINYPSIVPDLMERLPTSRSDFDQSPWKFPLVTIYKIIQFIKWVTF